MQLVVRVFNKYDGDDPALIAKMMARGDVIEVVADNHEWGRLDLTNPSWAILRAPISKAKAEAMKSADQDEFDPMGRIRAFHLDLEELIRRGYPIPTIEEAIATREAIAAEAEGQSRSEVKHSERYARATPIIDITEEDFDAAKKAKEPLIDPAIIG